MELDELNPFSPALSSGFSVCMCVCVQVMQVSINELCKGDFVCVCVGGVSAAGALSSVLSMCSLLSRRFSSVYVCG